MTVNTTIDSATIVPSPTATRVITKNSPVVLPTTLANAIRCP